MLLVNRPPDIGFLEVEFFSVGRHHLLRPRIDVVVEVVLVEQQHLNWCNRNDRGCVAAAGLSKEMNTGRVAGGKAMVSRGAHRLAAVTTTDWSSSFFVSSFFASSASSPKYLTNKGREGRRRKGPNARTA